MDKLIRIMTGGTFFHIRPHFSLAAKAFGQISHQLEFYCGKLIPEMEVHVRGTRMAYDNGGVWHSSTNRIETNDDVSAVLDEWIADPRTKIVFMPVAMCDFVVTGIIDKETGERLPVGKHLPRLKTSDGGFLLDCEPAEKVISKIRKTRKDIFLVGFKTTTGATEQEQFIAGLNLCKTASCNLVLVNDLETKVNMIITPEEAAYHVTTDRHEALRNLVEMAKLRSHLTFTQSTVVSGESVPWDSADVPASLRAVVDHCIARGAYKPFNGATVGHFAVKVNDTTFLTSKRKTNFNDLSKIGLVKVVTDGPDTVIAYGAKPSVGGQSQRIIFRDHPGMDCVVHFHCPMKPGALVPTRSQREVECGSHQCGANTSNGLAQFGNLKAVYLDQHGPNIVFNRNIDPAEVIAFIEANFDLTGKTGGYMV